MSDWLKRYERKRFGDNAPPVSDTLTRLEEERKKREAEKSAFYKTEFGVISGNAISALENDRIEQYTPVTEEEKQTIGKYRAYLQEQVERDRKYGTPQSDKKTKFITQGNTVESFASHLAEQSSHGMKQGLKNISNFFADLFAMQMQQTKYDPATMFAEAHGMIDKGYGEVYAGIVDKQTENITENIKEQTEKNIRDKIAISERYPDLGKIPRKVGEYGGSFAEIVPSIGLSFAAPNLGTFAFAANAYGNALSSSLMQGQDIYEARKNAGISFSASLAASKASQGVGKVIDKALVNMGVKQMMNKTLDDILMKGIVLTKDKIFPEIMRGVGTGLSFSAVNLGLNILRTDYKPTKKEVTITLTQGAIFGILNAAVRSVRMSAANRKSFETHYANVTSYLRALDYIGRHGTKAQIETAKANATVAVDNLIDFFMKNRFVGAGEETATMIRGLMVLKDGLLREPHSGILGDGSTPTQGTSVHTANIGKQVATPTTEPQQTETAPVTQRTATPDKVQPVTELGEVMQSLEPVQVGDTFVEKKSGNKITIVEADDNKVKIEIDNGENITSREISQFKAMELQDDERFEPANAQPEPVQEKVEKSAASEEIVAEQEPSLGTDKYIGKEYSDGEKTYKVAEHLLNGKEPVYLFEELKPDGSTKSFGAQIIKPDEIERHIKLLESQKNDYLKRQESKRIAEERRAVKQAQKDEQEKLMNEFLKPLSALEQGRHRKTLSVVKNYGEGYGAVTLREFIEKSVADNKEFKEAKTLKKKYYDIKTPREYIANIGAPREQFDVHKMYKENNLEKIKREHPFLYYKMTGDESVLDDSFYNKEYRVFENENTFIRVPKTAYDYAMFLSNNELTDDGKSGKIGLEREVVNDEKNQAGLHNDIHERREDGDRYSRADRKDGEVGRREAADGSGEGADGQIDSEHNRLRGEKTGGIENEEITYKKLDDAFVKTEEMQEIEIGNSKYGFKTVFISDAQQKIGGVIKNIGGYYHSGKIYLNVGKSKRGLSLNEKNRHELVHAIKAQNPAKYDALSQTFIKNVHVPKLKEALQSYKKKYTLSYGEDGELLLEEFIADVSYNLDNPNTQAVFVDFEKIKKAYEEFFGIDAEQGTRGIKEEVRAEVSDGETKKHENIVSLSKEIENSIADGNKLTFSQIQGMANKEFNGTLANNDYDIQDMYEAMELAFNNWVLNAKPNSATDIIKALDLMPTQTRRSEKKIKYQMFSTPPTLSYLANLAAHIQNNDIVLEPSAGTGSLAVFAIINGADVVVNELDGQRLELLKTLPIKIAFNEDAAHIGNILHDKFKPSIVVMNPPFSSAVTTNMKNTMLTINHIKSAFNMLPVGGRLVTITGQSYAPSENAFKNMVKALKNADFKANISFDGNVYAKYGTTFGTQIIVIDKLARGETTATDNMKTGAYDKNTLAEAENLLKNIERESIKENIFIDEREVKSDEGVDTGRIHGTVPGRSGRNADVRSGRSENTDDGRIQQDTRRGRGQDRSGIQSDGRDGLSGGVREGTVEKGTSPSDGDLRNDNRREIAESQKELVQDTDSFTHYNVPEFGFETGGVKLQKHPTLVVESNALALTPAPDITYKPNLPKWLVSSGGISDVQLEAVARAGQAFEQRLSTGERMGFFLGDGTGTGKGRTIAATILDSVRRGDERAVWFSQNKDLYRDANRDITAVWGDKKTDTTINLFEGGKKADASLSNGNITYMTYSTLQQNYQDADSNLNKLIGSLGEDFNGVIVFDESHNISNVGGEDSGRGRSKASKSAESAQELLARLPNAKALYVSATGIPKAERLPYLSRLGLWGDGTDFATSGELIAAITQNPDAELALMETLSQMLKRKGLYVSRNLSYSGVEYNQLKLPLSDTQKYEYDKFSGIWRKVFKEIFDSAVEATGGKETGNPLVTKLNKGFYGAAQRFFMSLNTIMKMDGIIEDAKKQIADGKQVVIQFYNTNEAGLDRAIQENVLMGNEESIELRPLQILEELIANIYPVQVMEEYVDDNGNKRWRYATDSEGNVIEDKEAIRKRGELLQEIRDLESMPDYRLTAMDKVINAFGKDKVAEVTGRKNYVVVDDKGNPKVAKRNSSTANSKEAAEFNSGKRDVLIFSLPSGGTGFSFHDTNGKQRAFYYAEMGWGAVAATQGEGRVHRAGELSKPIYTMPSNDMPIEKRTMSAITNRLAALGALTKGQRDSTENVNFDIESSTDNIYGRAGLKELYLELLKTKEGRESLANMAMLHRLVKDGEQVSPNDGIWTDTKKFLNTVPLLNYEDGVKITSRYFDIVEQLVERAKENGTFQEKLKRLPAEKVTITREVDNGSGLILREIDIVKKTTRTDYNPNLKTYKRKSDGLLVQARETSTYHDSNGDEVKNYRATQPNGNFEYLNEKSLERRFEILENAKEAWEKELSEIPQTYTIKGVTLSGEILGNYKLLPNDFKVNIVHAEGKAPYIGVAITNEGDVRSLLRKFDIAEETKNLSIKDIMDSVKAGKIVNMGRLAVFQSRVSGENRIEVSGIHPSQAQGYKDKGVFSEIINYKTRYFVPVDKAEKVLNDIKGSYKYSLDEKPDNTEHLFKPQKGEVESFSKQVDEWLKGEMKSDEHFKLGNTPAVLKALGAKKLPLIMTQDVIVKITGRKHSISLDEIKQLPQQIADPIMIFASDTVPGAFVVLTELLDKNGNDLVVAIHLNKKQTHISVNRVASVHPRTAPGKSKNVIGSFVEAQIKRGNLRYVDKNKSDEWLRRGGLQLPSLNTIITSNKIKNSRNAEGYNSPSRQDAVPNNNILHKEDIVNSYYTQNSEKMSLESEDVKNGRGLLLHGDLRRHDGESAGKQVKAVDGGTKEAGVSGKAGETSQDARRVYAKDVKDNGRTEVRRVGNGQVEAIKESAFNDEMRAIDRGNKKRGIKETVFFVGEGKIAFSNKIFKGMIADGIVAIRYDHRTLTPQQINKHEIAHSEYNTDRLQKVKNIIKNSLPVVEKRRIIHEVYKQYLDTYSGNEAKVFEEFVCDVLSGLNSYSVDFDKIVNDYWAGNEIVDYYNPADYAGLIDAGGFVDNVGFGEVRYSFNDGLGWHKGDLGKAESFASQYGGTRGTGHFGTGTYFVGENLKGDFGRYQTGRPIHSVDFSKYNLFTPSSYYGRDLHAALKAINSIYSESYKGIVKYNGAEYNQKFFVEEVLPSILNSGKDKVSDSKIKSAFNNTLNYIKEMHSKPFGVQRKADSASTYFMKQLGFEGVDVRHIKELDDTEFGSVIYDVKDSENRAETDLNNTDIRYSLDNDIEMLTPERIREIKDQFEKDRVVIPKLSKWELFGDRAKWVYHNATRVFPDIPERGEKGTFFAEFRKMMVQWRGLHTTSQFMTQYNLNEMTKDLSKLEFKTFSELVYFLDLQEEAKIQEERGYNEIFLPNEIQPAEVNAILAELEKETTPAVKKALEKRRKIWNELKEKYVALNGLIGFNTENRFMRENYYHHQVIEHMAKKQGEYRGGKGMEISAGRGWLKQRHGSTKAINTDFLAVEYKAMLQMQYDTYIANTWAKIAEQYDIKPKLEREAFEHNKSNLMEIIMNEAAKDSPDGQPVMIKKGGKLIPKSETYEQQQWYNKRIMLGFNGLFTLAKSGELPDFSGAYNDVINAFLEGNLDYVPQSILYKYIGELANYQLNENLTPVEEQAAISARTVLKYTSQKKAWIKGLLGDDYQTWETMIKHHEGYGVAQPRRGNYFYTKEVVAEDVFNNVVNEMVLNLIDGNAPGMTEDMKKLFAQHADTIRQIGAAYRQMVLPSEIIKTMEMVGNPKQLSDGAKLMRGLLTAWKGWATTLNPLRTVKFGIRNFGGDIEPVLTAKPQILKYTKQAVAEIYDAMRHQKYSSAFLEWTERGGYSSMIFANEMDREMQDKLFKHLKGKEGKSILNLPANIIEGYLNGVEWAHNFREAILRYAAYLYFRNELNKTGGVVADNVASNRFIVRGLKTVEDKAYQLSKDLLGAYDEINKLGQTLRQFFVPFYSFTESNFKRYKRMIENVLVSDDSISKKSAKLILRTLTLNIVGMLALLWSRTFKKDDDDKLPPSVRVRPHITLGSIGDNVYAFTRLGAFSEILEWFGLDDYKWDKGDIWEPLNQAFGMITPFLKLPIELTTGLNFYPEVTKPRAIRDKWYHFFNSWGVSQVYSKVTGKPSRGYGDIVENAFLYKYDYKESAYFEMQDRKREFQKQKDTAIYRPDEKSNALYYMKLAIRYGDKKAALKYLDKYFENGGTGKGVNQSFTMLNPMYGFTGKDTMEKGEQFVKTLSDNEKDKLKIAIDYYENELKLPVTVTELLKKKDITNEQAKNVLKKYINSKM